MTYGFGTREEMQARLKRANELLMRQILRDEQDGVEEADNCCRYCGGSGGADPVICRMCRGTGRG